MARKSKKKSPIITALIAIIALIAGLISYFNGSLDGDVSDTLKYKDFTVHYIDVGQGSSTLVQYKDKGVLIDAGESDYADKVCSYIKDCGVKELTYVIATHPHSDHIGGMPKVLSEFSVGTLYAPEIPERTLPTTRLYEKFLDTISENNINAEYADPGDSFTFEGAEFTFLGPVEDIDDLNNMSIITKAVYKGTAFLFCGDAEKEEMKALVDTDYDFNSDIYLMSHHGSRTGIYDDFLDRVSPQTVIISCGADNSYGHPHKQALEYIKDNYLEFYRTDEQGSIVITCTNDGYNISHEK